LARGIAIFFGLIALFAVTLELYLRSRTRDHWHRMEVAAEHELSGGGLQGLLSARAMALGGAAIAGDSEARATFDLANAMLVSEYGLGEASAALAAADAVELAPQASQRAQSLKLASRALLEAAVGNPARAESLARQSVALGQQQAAPLFALGRARVRQGDLVGAGHALQAAVVREPDFIEARVAWAEVWLEQGERAKARDGLLAALQHARNHGRARLLLAELGDVSPDGHSAPANWEATCARDQAISPFIAAACDLARADRAWRNRDRDGAIRFADSAGRRRPALPRVLGGAAQLLASLGAVDRASACLDEATQIANPALPSLRWAKLAVELGRGQLADPPEELPIASSPWAPILMARIALASGRIEALAANFPELRSGSTEFKALALLGRTDAGGEAASDPAAMDPVRAYVKGLQARLEAKPSLAAALLARAMHGHGDACRAAGEYLAVCQVLGRIPDATAFASVANENSRCVNLPAASAAAVAKRTRKHASRRAPQSR
jgi:hypothetical protein